MRSICRLADTTDGDKGAGLCNSSEYLVRDEFQPDEHAEPSTERSGHRREPVAGEQLVRLLHRWTNGDHVLDRVLRVFLRQSRESDHLTPESAVDDPRRRRPSHRAADADVVLRRRRSALMPAAGLTARGADRDVAPGRLGEVSGDSGNVADGGERVEIGSRLRHALHSKNSRNAGQHVCTRPNDRPRFTPQDRDGCEARPVAALPEPDPRSGNSGKRSDSSLRPR